MIVYSTPDWAIEAKKKHYDPDKDTITPVDAPVYGWRIVNPKSWEAGEIYTLDAELDTLRNGYRIYEHLYDAVEELGTFGDRVNMTWLARMRLTGTAYRPARRTCPFRVFHGSTITLLWMADPATVLHNFVLSIINDWIPSGLPVHEMTDLKHYYIDDEYKSSLDLDQMRGQLTLLNDALNPNPLYSVYHVFLGLKLQEERAAVASYEHRLNELLMSLTPTVVIE